MNPLANVRLGAIALVVLAGGFLIMSQLGIGRSGSRGVAEDASVLAVVASDLVTASKDDAGAADAIGGYLPGVGIVLTVHLDEIENADMNAWVAKNLDPFADRISMLPDGEAVVVTLDVAAPNPTARVWSLQPSDITRTEGWERLVAPATFVAAGSADASAPSSLASADDGVSTGSDPDDDDDGNSGQGLDDGDAETAAPASSETEEPDQAETVSADSDGGDGDGNGDGGEDVAADGDDADAGSQDGAFYDNDLWSPIFGSWTLSGGIYSQSDATGFGYSSEYMGDTPDEFDVGVSMRAPFGDMNAGIIYGQPNKGSKAGSTVIDITGEGTYLRWGAYDPDNGEWVFTGGAPIDPPIVADEFTRLDLEVRSDQTAINLNGEFIASIDSPPPGGVALVVSVANIEFKDFELTAAAGSGEPANEEPRADEDPEATPDEGEADETEPEDGDATIEDGDTEIIVEDDGVGGNGGNGGDGGVTFEIIDDDLADWQLLSGSWTASEGIVSQNNGDGYDQMIHFLDAPVTNYRVEVKLRAKPDSRFSGGLLFNVSRTGTRSNSYVFDIVNNGQDVRWATYDSNGVFSYIGGVRIADGFDPADWHLIAVEMRDGRAQFFIDGSEIGASQDVGTDGHVGMVTSLAAMEFSDFAIVPIDDDA